MKLKVVLTLLVLLTLVVTIHVYAYSASTNCSRSSHTYASASISSSGLRNGSWNVSARVNHGSSDSGRYTNNTVSAHVSDMGSSTQLGRADAYVDGLDSNSIYQASTSNCSIP